MIGISRLYCGAVDEAEKIRYGGHAHGGGERKVHKRPVVVWNCTQQCNLTCVHCYSRSDSDTCGNDMSTDQAKRMLDDLAAFGSPVILFSGGEPLMRRDLPALIEHAVSVGLRAVLSTNGMLITPETAEVLGELGLRYVGVSLDGMRETHDKFRRREGAFNAALAGMRNAKAAGIKVGLRLTLNRANADQLDDIFGLMSDEGIPRVCFYHLVTVGRGEELTADSLDHAATRVAVDKIIDHTARLHAAGNPLEVLTVDNHADGPYLYLRMLREGNERAADVLRLMRVGGGNATGRGIGCVSWDGTVHPDQFWRTVSLGNVLERPFSEIWTDHSHPVMAKLADRRNSVKGRCETCRFFDVCGGNLRARAEAATGDPWACDPACYLTDEEIAGPPPEAETL